MQNGLGPTVKQAFVNWLLRNQAPPAIAAVYVALWQGDPGPDGSQGAEVTTTATGYARQAATFSAPVNGVTQLAVTVTFPDPAADYGAEVTHWALFDAATNGNILLRGEFDEPFTVNLGDTAVELEAGDLPVQVS